MGTQADQVALVTLVDEAEAEPSPPNPGPGDRHSTIINRIVALPIDELLWSRPSVTVDEGPIEIEAWGLLVNDGERIAWGAESGQRIVVGRTSVMPFAPYDDRWGLLSAAAVGTPLARHHGELTDAHDVRDPMDRGCPGCPGAGWLRRPA